MADKINWNELGVKDADNETPRKADGFPDDTAKNDYNEGFNNKWWEKGNDDARGSRAHRTNLPNDRDLVVNYHDGYEDGSWN